MRFSTKCWSEHILSAYKATKDLKHPLYMTFNYKPGQHVIIFCQNLLTIFLAYWTKFSTIFTSADNSYLTYPYPTRVIDKKMNNNMLSMHWLYRMSRYSIINFQYGRHQRKETLLVNCDIYMKSKRKISKCMQAKESIRNFDADRKICPSGSLFGITWQSLVMPNSDAWTDFSIGTSHP